LPQLANGLGVGIEVAGQVVCSYSMTYALGAPVVITLVAKWTRGQVVVWALAAFTAANLFSALAPTFPIMLAIRVAAGLSAALFTPSGYAVAPNWRLPIDALRLSRWCRSAWRFQRSSAYRSGAGLDNISVGE
jgi:predicted MFS family arabinose efflux permease